MEGTDDTPGKAEALHAVSMARVLGATSMANALSEDFDLGIDCAREAEETFSQTGLKKRAGKELLWIAEALMLHETPLEALEYAQSALDTFIDIDIQNGWQATAVETIVLAHLLSNDVESAVRAARESLEVQQASEHRREEAAVYSILSHALLERGSHSQEEALRMELKAVELAEAMGDSKMLPRLMHNLSIVHMERQDYHAAIKASQQAVELFHEDGNITQEAMTLHALGYYNCLTGEHQQQGMEFLTESQELLRDVGNRREEVFVMCTQAMLHAVLPSGDIATGIRNLEKGRAIAQGESDWRAEGTVLEFLVNLHVEKKDFKAALDLATQRVDLMRKTSWKVAEAAARLSLSHIRLHREEYKEALTEARRAQTIYQQLSNRVGEGYSLVLIVQGYIAMADMTVSPDTTDADAQDSRLRNLEKAFRAAVQAVGIGRTNRDKHLHAMAKLWRGQVQIRRGSMSMLQEVVDDCKDAAVFFRQRQDWENEAMCMLMVALAKNSLGRLDEAKENAKIALDLHLERESEGEVHARELLERLEPGQWMEKRAVSAPPVKTVEAEATKKDVEVSKSGSQPLAEGEEPKGLSRQVVSSTIKALAGNLVIDVDLLSGDAPLMDFGLDSLSGVELRNAMSNQFSLKLPQTIIFDMPTVRSLTAFIVEVSKR